MSNNYKVGDWVYCEFKLGQVANVRGGHVIEFSDGYGTLSSQSLNNRIVPLTLANKLISEEFELWYGKIQKEGGNGLNFPEIHPALVHKWMVCCAVPESRELVNDHYAALSAWCEGLLKAARSVEYDGIQLLRR